MLILGGAVEENILTNFQKSQTIKLEKKIGWPDGPFLPVGIGLIVNYLSKTLPSSDLLREPRKLRLEAVLRRPRLRARDGASFSIA